MADSWDADDFEPPPPPKPIVPNEFGDEDVKESWEDRDTTPVGFNANEQTISQPSTAEKQSKKPPKKDKKDKISNAQAVTEADHKKLTAAEMEELSRNADLALTKQLFGVTDEQNGTASGFQGPNTKEEFSVYCQLLVKEIRKHQNKSEYYNFLSELFRELCLNLESEHVRRYGKEISAIGAELHKNEKEAEKAKAKSKKKPTVMVGRKADLLDDIVDVGEGGGRYDDIDDDDFM